MTAFLPLPQVDLPRPVAEKAPRVWRTAVVSGALAALPLVAFAVTTAVLIQLPIADATPNEPANMSSLKVQGLAGYPVHDSNGALIGEVERVETDDQGRTRYLRIDLTGGREARLSAFRARLDEEAERIDLVMPLYAVEMAAGPGGVQAASLMQASASAETIALSQ